MLIDYFDRYAREYVAYKRGAWCYEDGCLYRGLECLHRATGDPRWFQHLTAHIEHQLRDGPSLRGYDLRDYNIDNILSGRALLYLHEVTGEQRYLDYASLLVEQLATHPRTQSGVYWHKFRYPWQIWLDGLYMAGPFQISFGLRTGERSLVEDSLTQISRALDLTFVAETGLYAHAFDESRKQPWADSKTGHSAAHWSRALGWLCMALTDIAELVDADDFLPLKAQTKALLQAILQLRHADGLWMQVIDQPHIQGNYAESSASAMFVYALVKGERLGLIDKIEQDLIADLVKGTVKRGADGRTEMVNICEVAGLGEFNGRFRDGSAAYYFSENVVSDDIKGVGPLMMSEALRLAHQTEPPALIET